MDYDSVSQPLFDLLPKIVLQCWVVTPSHSITHEQHVSHKCPFILPIKR